MGFNRNTFDEIELDSVDQELEHENKEDKNIFDYVELDLVDQKLAYDNKEDKNIFDYVEANESWGKYIARSLAQIPLGLAKVATFPLDLLQMMGSGDVFDPEEIDRIRAISEREGIPFDEEKYLQAGQQALDIFPTQSNIERAIEEKTGVPLQPKTTGQKLTRLGFEASSFNPGTLSQKASTGVTASGTSGGLRAAGVPEPIADIAGFGAGQVAGAKAPKISIEKQTKPSGLPVRRFESTKKPTTVSPARKTIINEKVEADFRKISDNLLETGTAREVHQNLKTDASFKRKVSEGFKEVKDLAKQLPEEFSSNEIKKKIAKSYQDTQKKGFAPSEYEKEFTKLSQRKIDEIFKEKINASDLVDQYRKNNGELTEFFEPGKSKSLNRAKKDALIENNRVIQEVIEEKYPDSEFSKLFKEKNKEWMQINDIERIDGFIDDMFAGKVDFKKGQKFYNDQFKKSFERSLGKENFKSFELLMDDLMGTQKAHSLLKEAGNQGFGDLATTASWYMLNPKIGSIKHGAKIIKPIYQMALDKPKFTIKWDNGIKAMEAGKFSQADKIFKELDAEVKSSLTKEEALKMFNARKKKLD